MDLTNVEETASGAPNTMDDSSSFAVPQKDDVARAGRSDERRAEEKTPAPVICFTAEEDGPVLVVLVLMLGAADVGATSMPGGLCPVPTDDPGVLKAIRVAEEDFNHKSSDLFHTAVSNVISAQKQVVSGFMYHLTLELRTTVCRKRSVSRNCPFHKDPQYAKTMTCKFQVLEHPWIGPTQVTESSCSRTAK
ncbi:cystatin-2-like [Mobula hypostoma]|uniref:cystatin-2-like n=1 Tax=Mobula hypostoma TaxID=723540 RepID=UPI002FC34B25